MSPVNENCNYLLHTFKKLNTLNIESLINSLIRLGILIFSSYYWTQDKLLDIF